MSYFPKSFVTRLALSKKKKKGSVRKKIIHFLLFLQNKKGRNIIIKRQIKLESM